MERFNIVTGKPFEDRQHILYVNASYEGDDPLGMLMHDFLCSDPDDMLTPLLAEKARYLKTDPKGGRSYVPRYGRITRRVLKKR